MERQRNKAQPRNQNKGLDMDYTARFGNNRTIGASCPMQRRGPVLTYSSSSSLSSLGSACSSSSSSGSCFRFRGPTIAKLCCFGGGSLFGDFGKRGGRDVGA